MEMTDRCDVRHFHTLTLEFGRDEAPRVDASWNSRSAAILVLTASVDANTGEPVYVGAHRAVYVKANGEPGLQEASLGRVKLEKLPDEVVTAIRTRGAELAHQVTT